MRGLVLVLLVGGTDIDDGYARSGRAAAFIFAIAVYLSVGIPASRTVAAPLQEETREDQVEALRVLSAGNTIMIVLLGAVLVLQVSPCTLPSASSVSDGSLTDAPVNLLSLQAGEQYARRLEGEVTASVSGKPVPPRSQEAGEDKKESKKDK